VKVKCNNIYNYNKNKTPYVNFDISAIAVKVKTVIEKTESAIDAVKIQIPTSSDVDSAQKSK
jgi:hypothetical protein